MVLQIYYNEASRLKYFLFFQKRYFKKTPSPEPQRKLTANGHPVPPQKNHVSPQSPTIAAPSLPEEEFRLKNAKNG